MMTETCESWLWISASRSSPLQSGRARSNKARSKLRCPRRANPSSPLPAVSTEYPSRVSNVSSDSRIADSSSMINTDPPFCKYAASFTWFRVITAASDIDCLSDHRKIEIERSAFAGAAFNANLARVLLDDSIADRQTQARATGLSFARCFGREEGIVNAMDVLLRDAGAGIGYLHAHHVPVGSRNT